MSFVPTRVIDIELSQPLGTLERLHRYGSVYALVRLHGRPVGSVELPVEHGQVSEVLLRRAVLEQLNWPLINRHLAEMLFAPELPPVLRATTLPYSLPAPTVASATPSPGARPRLTVAVCTRNRAQSLRLCLDALVALDYEPLELLVIDNAPSDDSTERLVRRYPQVRYVREPRPGLNWARNRAIIEAGGEILAYTDDDVVVDAGWARALADIFVENAEVMAVTGLVVPYELEAESQALFEQYGGFGRGYERQWYRVSREDGELTARLYGWTGRFGTGANMAFRRSLFAQIGHFDPALDVGTVTNGGGDLEMFFRVLKGGHLLAYEPAAIVRHRHRRDRKSLSKQIAANGVGFSAYLVCCFLAHRDERLAIIRFWFWWLRVWHAPRALRSLLGREPFPRDMVLAEFWGYFVGLTRYQQARRNAEAIAHRFGPALPSTEPADQMELATR